MRRLGNLVSILKTELANMHTYVVLLLVNINNYQKASLEALKYLAKEEGLPGVYVSVNRPYIAIRDTLISEDIDVETMVFIDAITKISGGTAEKVDNCLYLEGPENLTDFSISITEAVSALKFSEKFLFFDSANTLLVYNDAESVSRFFHFLTSRIRLWGVKGLVVALDRKTEKDVIAQISQFCDKVIDLGEG